MYYARLRPGFCVCGRLGSQKVVAEKLFYLLNNVPYSPVPSPDAIKAQLGHRVPDRLGTAYNRTQHIDERTRMMQEWADYLDGLK